MPDHENFCDKTPYYFAYVMLIFYWILIPIVIFGLCVAFFSKTDNDMLPENPEFDEAELTEVEHIESGFTETGTY